MVKSINSLSVYTRWGFTFLDSTDFPKSDKMTTHLVEISRIYNEEIRLGEFNPHGSYWSQEGQKGTQRVMLVLIVHRNDCKITSLPKFIDNSYRCMLGFLSSQYDRPLLGLIHHILVFSCPEVRMLNPLLWVVTILILLTFLSCIYCLLSIIFAQFFFFLLFIANFLELNQPWP